MAKPSTPTARKRPRAAQRKKTRRRAPRASTKRTAALKAADERKAAQARFLEAFATEFTVFHAARRSGVGRRTHYAWLAEDPDYAVAFQAARDCATDLLEREAVRRAIAGQEEPVHYQGQVVGHVRKKSDTLLIFLLKANNPEKFRERFEHTGPNGVPLPTPQHQHVHLYMPDNGRPRRVGDA